jgi:hypothetical protein
MPLYQYWFTLALDEPLIVELLLELELPIGLSLIESERDGAVVDGAGAGVDGDCAAGAWADELPGL